MLALAAGALVLALKTKAVRRSRDFAAGLSPAAPPSAASFSAAGLPGLRYVPENPHWIMGMNVARAMRDPAATELLAEAQAEDAVPVLEQLKTWTGLAMADLDHVVVAIRRRSRTIGFTAVVVGVRPVDPGQVRRALNESAAIELALGRPDPRTVILSFPSQEEARQQLWAPIPNERAVSSAILSDHVPPDSWLWFVGRPPRDNSPSQEPVWTVPLLPPAWSSLQRMEAVAAWARPPGIHVGAYIQCATPMAARKLRPTIEHSLGGNARLEWAVHDRTLQAEGQWKLTAALRLLKRWGPGAAK